MPPGRRPVATRVRELAAADTVYRHVAERLAKGEQAYIVVPVIDESDLGLTAVHSHLQALSQGHLHSHRLAALHGRLSRDERDEIMGRFRDVTIDALVTTTVIEVGVDVPNASIMVIEHAQRFGLAQLHQLRGRIARATRKSLCVLLADSPTHDSRCAHPPSEKIRRRHRSLDFSTRFSGSAPRM